MVSLSQFFGGGVGYTGGSLGAFDPRRERVLHFDSGFSGAAAFHAEDVSNWPAGLTYYAVNDSGSAQAVGDVGLNYSHLITDGYTGVLTLRTPNASGGVWIFRQYQHNTAGRTHGQSTRSGTIASVLAANARATIAAPDCDVWALAVCDNSADVLYSRQEGWSAYEGQAVRFSFDDSCSYRSVVRASTITKPIDTRDLLSMVVGTVTSGCTVPETVSPGPTAYCSDSTPAYFAADIQGLTFAGDGECVEFISPAWAGKATWLKPNPINGLCQRLDYVGAPGSFWGVPRWQKAFPTVPLSSGSDPDAYVQVTTWSGGLADCQANVDPPTYNSAEDLYIMLNLDHANDQWIMAIATVTYFFFYSTQPVTKDGSDILCLTPPATFTNQLTTLGAREVPSNSGPTMATGGTVTITIKPVEEQVT